MMKKILYILVFVLVAVFLLSTAMADGNNLPEGVIPHIVCGENGPKSSN